jgi:hypothetical protein
VNNTLRFCWKAAGTALLAVTLFENTAAADPAGVEFHNPNPFEVRLSVDTTNEYYEGSKGQNVLVIPANGKAYRHTGRDSSHSGSYGTARYHFDPSPIGTYSEVQVHGGNGVGFGTQHANRYPGTFMNAGTAGSPNPSVHVYILAKSPPKTEREGEWEFFCSVATCKKKSSQALTQLDARRQSSRSQSEETRDKQEICAEVAGSGAVYSAKVNGCVSKEGIHRTDINLEEEMREKTRVTELETFSLDTTKMGKLGIDNAYTWVWKANKGNGWTNQMYVGRKRTGRLSCPVGTAVPTYLPGTPENDRDSCTKVVLE